MSKISIKDMARALNTSTAAISYVLNGRAREMRISDSLAKKILKYAKDNDYNPSALSKSLRTGRTDIICLMVEDIAESFFAGIAARIAELARPLGQKIVYMSTDNDTEKTRELIRDFRRQKVDGFIITPPVGIDKDIRELIKDEIPVVIFDRPLENTGTPYVGVDNEAGAYDAVMHLHQQEFRHIAFITLDSPQTQFSGRLAGYKRAVQKMRSPVLVKKLDYTEKYTPEAVGEIAGFLAANPGIDAVFFATGYLAISGLEALQQLGLTIGKDIGMIVFDDNNFLRAHSPSITAVAQPIDDLCSALIRMLNTRINEKPQKGKPTRPTAETAILPVSLMIRQSSMPLPPAAKKAAAKPPRVANPAANSAPARRPKRAATIK